MAWAWIRPADPSVLDGRPLLDVGTGDGQTLASLAHGRDLYGVDSSIDVLRAARAAGLDRIACAEARALPFADGGFATVLAGDVFHHLPTDGLVAVLTEVKRVLRPAGTLVAWWYAVEGRPGPDAPRFPRSVEDVVALVVGAGFAEARPLDLEASMAPVVPTVGVLARR